MTDDQFEKLARLIKETADKTVELLRDEITASKYELRVEINELRTEMREGFTRNHEELADFAHASTHSNEKSKASPASRRKSITSSNASSRSKLTLASNTN